jgi:hypothetical protein
MTDWLAVLIELLGGSEGDEEDVGPPHRISMWLEKWTPWGWLKRRHLQELLRNR